ncbi:MAG: hypothetical protein RLW61_00840 [Gammaproteobacteria bacterium]
MSDPAQPAVVAIGAADGVIGRALVALFARWQLAVAWLPPETTIPGSYWGEREAGLVRGTLYVRADTPVHSALHEACHYACADDARRAVIETDAGGDDLEECAVCYLSIALADALPGFGRARMLADMDAWGYSFRLGSAARWFAEDADDARAWLVAHGLPTAWPPAPAQSMHERDV